jgi:hypothetical protein
MAQTVVIILNSLYDIGGLFVSAWHCWMGSLVQMALKLYRLTEHITVQLCYYNPYTWTFILHYSTTQFSNYMYLVLYWLIIPVNFCVHQQNLPSKSHVM